MPSRLKVGWRWNFKADGDLRAGDLRADLEETLPLVVLREEAGMSMWKLSLLGAVKGLAELGAVDAVVVVAEWGESPVDEGDMVVYTRLVGKLAEVVRWSSKAPAGRRAPTSPALFRAPPRHR